MLITKRKSNTGLRLIPVNVTDIFRKCTLPAEAHCSKVCRWIGDHLDYHSLIPVYQFLIAFPIYTHSHRIPTGKLVIGHSHSHAATNNEPIRQCFFKVDRFVLSWNSLPSEVQHLDSILGAFKRLLKTVLFSSMYDSGFDHHARLCGRIR